VPGDRDADGAAAVIIASSIASKPALLRAFAARRTAAAGVIAWPGGSGGRIQF
jgi:hypothetical protein